MIYLTHEEGCQPVYKTRHAACADVVARVDVVLPQTCTAGTARAYPTLVPTGLRISAVDLEQYAGAFIPELQLRARSGLSMQGIILANGIGTIDADYRDEIKVPLINLTGKPVTIRRGERIAQLTLGLRPKLVSALLESDERSGGFGSTGND